MDFSLEEAFDVIYELVLASGFLFLVLHMYLKVHTYV